jgi:hypothetical protein
MDPQLIVVVMLVSAAALYLARRTLRTWAGRGGSCSKGCGCGKSVRSPVGLIPSEELTLRQAAKRT